MVIEGGSEPSPAHAVSASEMYGRSPPVPASETAAMKPPLPPAPTPVRPVSQAPSLPNPAPLVVPPRVDAVVVPPAPAHVESLPAAPAEPAGQVPPVALGASPVAAAPVAPAVAEGSAAPVVSQPAVSATTAGQFLVVGPVEAPAPPAAAPSLPLLNVQAVPDPAPLAAVPPAQRQPSVSISAARRSCSAGCCTTSSVAGGALSFRCGARGGLPLESGHRDECLDAADRLGELLAPVLAAPARGGVAGVGQLGTAVRGLRRFLRAGTAVDLIGATTVVVRELHRSLTGLLAVLDVDQITSPRPPFLPPHPCPTYGSPCSGVFAGGVAAGGVSAGGGSAGGGSIGGVSAGGGSAGGVSAGGVSAGGCSAATPFPSSLSPQKRPPLHLRTVAMGGETGRGRAGGRVARMGCADWVRRLQCRRPPLACPAGASVGELAGAPVGELAGASVGEPAGVLVGGSDGGVAGAWANTPAISLAGRWRFCRGLLAGPLAFAIASAAAVMMSTATRRDGHERTRRGARH
ncbi:unnamed protein product [Closterium sp. Naga37s-1]|nr:unnamed protein product [Closterium sp. Naga37s-1]